MDDTLKQLIELLDTALMSKDPAIKTALKKLLFIVTLTIAEDSDDRVEGPLSEIFRRLEALETRGYVTTPWTGTGTGVAPWTGTGVGWPTVYGGGTTTSAGVTITTTSDNADYYYRVVKDQNKQSWFESQLEEEYKELLDDLKMGSEQ